MIYPEKVANGILLHSASTWLGAAVHFVVKLLLIPIMKLTGMAK